MKINMKRIQKEIVHTVSSLVFFLVQLLLKENLPSNERINKVSVDIADVRTAPLHKLLVQE